MTGPLHCDLLVIGAGSGGLSVAAGAAQMGARVILVEKGRMGGDCLNTGCVPSKALLAAAKAAHAGAAAAPFGVGYAAPTVDFERVHDHVHEVIAAIAPHDSVERFESLGVTVLRESARFLDRRRMAAGDHVLCARRIVLATGSRPRVPPVPGLDEVPYLTNETIFDLRERPRHLVVIGAGPIGLEMAQAFRRLGSTVTVLEKFRALPKDDPEIAAIALAALRGEGLAINEGVEITAVSGTGGAIRVAYEDAAGAHSVEGSHLLVATGRAPVIEALGLDAAGIAHDAAGIAVDARLRTSNRRVYAIGDCRRGLQFTHVAGYEAGIVLRNALFHLPARANYDAVPWVTYTDPEIAHVGLGEAAARERFGDRVRIICQRYDGNDRAQAERATGGLFKLVAHAGRPLGVSIVGAGAGELIQIWALALARRLKLADIAGFIAPYPTFGEIGKRAAGAYFSDRLFSARTRAIVRFLQRFG